MRRGYERFYFIIGGGLQDAAIAFERSRRGVRVTLVERNEQIMNKVVPRNERKLHLGLNNSAGPTEQTAPLQFKGGLSFLPLMKRWLGEQVLTIGLSTPYYAMIAAELVTGQFASLADLEREVS